jgi:tetratricopeptide (TPR) repeat protein
MLGGLQRAWRAFLGDPAARAEAPPGGPGSAGWLGEQLGKIAAGAPHEAFREAAAAVSCNPVNPEAHYALGKAALAQGDVDRACAALARAAELAPGRAEFRFDLGLALERSGDRSGALSELQSAAALQHDHVPALFHAGRLHSVLGEAEEARDCYSLALAFDPRSSAARIELAKLYESGGDPEAAVRVLEEAVVAEIADGDVLCELAGLAARQGEVERAVSLCSGAIGRFPRETAPLVNLGLIRLLHFGEGGAAEALFRRAAGLDPRSIEATANLGLALQEQGRFEAALEHYESAIRARPEVVEFRWNRGLANLLLGNFASAWEDYELRKVRPDAGGVHEKFTLPAWNGASLAGRSILVYGEQGLGDEIMFASCLDAVIARADLTVVECDARLAALYSRSFPQARIEPRGPSRDRDWRVSYPSLELQSAVGSLPHHLRRQDADFPERNVYLEADGGIRGRWRERLRALGPSRKIGISWRGGTLATRGALRSLSLDELGPLLDADDVTFVVLQRGLLPAERAALAARSNVHIPGDVEDIDELAGLIAALDLLISVPTTNVHLAGALGRPLWIFLTCSPEWRYLWEGERMPWYPTARLLRQPRPREWQPVVETARAWLTGAGG